MARQQTRESAMRGAISRAVIALLYLVLGTVGTHWFLLVVVPYLISAGVLARRSRTLPIGPAKHVGSIVDPTFSSDFPREERG